MPSPLSANLRSEKRFACSTATGIGPDNGEYQGAFSFVTVTGGEFVDSNFRSFPSGVVKVTQPTTVYLRYLNPSGAGPATATLTSLKQDETVLQTAVSLTLNKLGSSQAYLGSFTAVPEWYSGAVSSPSIQIALGGGHLKAVQTTAAPSRIRALAAESANGGVLAFAPSAFPGTLVLKFMRWDGSALTPSPDSDPNHAGTVQQTEIGSKTDDYAEKVWLEIQAVNPNHPTQIQDTNAPVGIAELPHANYTLLTAAFYDGSNGSTELDDSGKIGGSAAGAFVAMVHGKADVELSAVADARRYKADGSFVPLPYSGASGAALQPVPSNVFDPALPRSGDSVNVNHWVDERTYERRRGDKAKSWGTTDTTNKLRDWLEKKVWDFYADQPSGGDAELEQAFTLITNLAEDPNGNFSAKVDGSKADPTLLHKITWNPVVPGVRHFVAGSLTEAGYRTDLPDEAHEPFVNIAIHEPRHSWQYWLSTPRASGGEGMTDADNDFLPASPPASAKELWDSAYSGAGGSNPDFYFRTESVPDPVATLKSAIERDAIRFAAAKAGDTYSCVIDSPPSLVSTDAELNPTGGGTATLKVKVTYGGGTALPGMPVKWTLVSGAGISGCGASVCYSEADQTGVAMLFLNGTPGPYEVEARVGPPLDPADCAGVDTEKTTIQGAIQP